MSKKEILLVIIGTVFVVGLAGLGGWRMLQSRNKTDLTYNKKGTRGAYSEQSLTPGPSQSDVSNRLNVDSSGSSNNLGQLTPDSSNSTESSPKSSTASMLDPATFGQYDKYKESKAAMFAEIQVGTGEKLTAGKKAVVYYKGWLTDGKLFDMSRTDKEGKLQPFVFTMGAHQVIPGWEQSMFDMKVGGIRMLIVPPAVGYGVAGKDPIPGNAVLVFQVQLLAVQ